MFYSAPGDPCVSRPLSIKKLVLVQSGNDVLDSDKDLQVLEQGPVEERQHQQGALTSRRFQLAYASPRALRLTPRNAKSDNLAKLRRLMALQEQGHRFAALGGAN